MTELEALVPELPFDNKIVVFYSYKGGVGRTMALGNVAAWLAAQHAQRSDVRILCMDLDLEAPSLPAFLPPPKEQGEVAGFLGLLRDYLSRDQERESALEGHLKPGDSDYLYRVAGTQNLFVLPAGRLDAGERSRVLYAMQQMLERAVSAKDPEQTRASAPFFTDLQQALRRHYSYVLVDSRTGLTDEAFATIVLLADAVVLLFRPNTTQLYGIQDVLIRFLYQRGLKATDPEVPVFPVLSPRPPYSDPRLREVRRLAQKHVFKWLDIQETADPGTATRAAFYTPPAPQLLELPFDATFEIGEALLMPLPPERKVADPEAPLYRAYYKLAATIQKHNARNDVLGAARAEMEHYQAGRREEAFKYLLARIARETDEISHWESLWERYSEHLASQVQSKGLFWDFCTTVLERPDLGEVPRFYANLWLSGVFADMAPDQAVTALRDAWTIACRTRHPSMLHYALSGVVSYYQNNPSQTLPGLPGYADTVKALVVESLKRHKTRASCYTRLASLARYYTATPQESELAVRILQDLLRLAVGSSSRSVTLGELAQIHLHRMDFPNAWSCLQAAAELPGAPLEIREQYITLLAKLGERAQAERAIAAYLPKFSKPAKLIWLEIVHRTAIPTGDAKPKRLDFKAQDPRLRPRLRGYALLQNRRFAEAAAALEQGFEARDVAISDLALLHLVRWLVQGGPLSQDAVNWAFSQVQNTDANAPTAVIGCLALPFALAANPEKVYRIAREKLAQSCWPLHRLGWQLVACTAAEGYQHYQESIRAQLRQTPLLALYFRRDENFQLLRFVWENHKKHQVISAESFCNFMELYDLIDQGPVPQAAAQAEHFQAGAPMIDDKSPELTKIVDDWLAILAPILDHSGLGDLIKAILEADHQASFSR